MKKQCNISVSVCLEIVVLRFIVRWLKMLRIIKKQVKFKTKFTGTYIKLGYTKDTLYNAKKKLLNCNVH